MKQVAGKLTDEQEQELLVLLKAGDQESAIEKYRVMFPNTSDGTAHDTIRKVQERNGIPWKWRKKDLVKLIFILPLMGLLLVAIPMVGYHSGPWTRDDLQFFIKFAEVGVPAYCCIFTFMFALRPLGRLIDRSPSLQVASAFIAKALVFVFNAALLGFFIYITRSC